MKKFAAFILFLGALSPVAYATHLLGGEIQVKKINSQALTYEIIAKIYFDGTGGLTAANNTTDIKICVGDGKNTVVVPRTSLTALGNRVLLGVYTATYTYASAGRYTVSAGLENRSNDIRNIRNSANTPFSIQTTFSTDGANSTPVLNAPIGLVSAGVRQIYNYNVNATDADGDSLVYRLGHSKQQEESCTTTDIKNFVYPNETTQEGVFRLNARNGDLTWNAPTAVGFYAFVIVVEEWRNGVKISETQRDLMVQVEDKGGPSVAIPPFELSNDVPGIVTSVLEPESSESILRVFPSPAHTQLKAVYVSPQANTPVFQLVDAQGRIVAEHRENTPKHQHEHVFDLQQLATGTYFVRVATDRVLSSRKVLKN